MYYYADVGADFRDKYSPNRQSTFRLPLNVVGFSTLTDNGVSHFRQEIAIHIDSTVSPLAAVANSKSTINYRLHTFMNLDIS